MSSTCCFSGTVNPRTPKGCEDFIHGLNTYVAVPSNNNIPSGLLVLIPDVFGWKTSNIRLLADLYAERGNFLVYIPDFMDGMAAPVATMETLNKLLRPGSWITALLEKPFWFLQVARVMIPFIYRQRASVTTPRIVEFFTALRMSTPPFPANTLKIGAIGYCWGGAHALMLAQNLPHTRVRRHSSQTTIDDAEPLVDRVFLAHPSNIHVPGDIRAVMLPTSVIVGHNDMALSPNKIGNIKEILTVEKTGRNHEVTILHDAKHGFALRVDPSDEFQMRFAEVAETKVIEWFEKMKE